MDNLELHYGLQNVVYLWKLFGLFPYYIDKSLVCFSLKWLIGPVMLIVTTEIATLSHFCVLTKKNIIHSFVNIVDTIVMGIFFIYRFIYWVHINRTVVNVFYLLFNVSKRLSDLEMMNKRQIFAYWSVMKIILFLTVPVLDLCLKCQRNVYDSLCFHFMHLVLILFVLFSLDILRIIKRYFEDLKISIICQTAQKVYQPVKLEFSVYCYDVLTSACDCVGDAFALDLLVFILNFFLDFLGICNAFLLTILQESKISKHCILAEWYYSIVSVMLTSFFVLQIVGTCTDITEEAKEFNTLLYQIMIDDKTNEIASNKKLRLHIAMKREVVFTACGFFNLDYSLIHSMIAAATTYLVILIQFGQPTATSQTTSSTILNDTISENFTSFTTPFTPFFTTTLS